MSERITTVEELDALPVGSVVRTDDGCDTWVCYLGKYGPRWVGIEYDPWGRGVGVEHKQHWLYDALPLTVLYRPDTPAPSDDERDWKGAYRDLVSQIASPPPGWYTLGTHVDQEVHLEFWGEGGGVPIWERPAPSADEREARVHIEWGDSALHDDEWEYTCSSDCDGSNVMYQRRHPRHRGEYHPWEPATRLAYDAAVRASSPSESEA